MTGVQGLEILIAAQSPAAVRQLAPDLPATLLPAPKHPPRPRRRGEAAAACFPGALLREGWEDPAVLTALVEAWRNLFRLTRADILIAQAAPTALLAARGLGMGCVILGSGYDNPPAATPMPVFDPALTGAPEQEAAATRAANAALRAHAAPEVGAFADILTCELSLLATWPELDHYPNRADLHPDHARPIGPLITEDAGAPAAWRDRGAPRVFAYLRPGLPASAATFGALHRMAPDLDVLLAAPGVAPEEARRLIDRGVQVVDGPVRLSDIMEGCDLGVSHGGTGVSSLLALRGVPQICLPGHQEQAMLTRTLAGQGAARGLGGRFGSDEAARMLSGAVGDQGLRDGARALSDKLARHGATPPEDAAMSLLQGAFSF